MRAFSHSSPDAATKATAYGVFTSLAKLLTFESMRELADGLIADISI